MMIDRDTYCKDCKRSIWGEFPDCDINIENDGKYCKSTECGCKVPMDRDTEESNGDPCPIHWNEGGGA